MLGWTLTVLTVPQVGIYTTVCIVRESDLYISHTKVHAHSTKQSSSSGKWLKNQTSLTETLYVYV